MRLGYRMYDASTGRFISRDPIQDGYNWYTSVRTTRYKRWILTRFSGFNNDIRCFTRMSFPKIYMLLIFGLGIALAGRIVSEKNDSFTVYLSYFMRGTGGIIMVASGILMLRANKKP